MGLILKRVYHTQNSNHLDQNIDLNKHKLSFLVKIILRNVMLFFKETITKLSTML